MLPSLKLHYTARVAPQYYDRLRRASTQATLHYLEPLEEYRTTKPYYINVPEGSIPGGSHTNEVSKQYHNIRIHDLREVKSKISLDREGFEVVREDPADPEAASNCLAHGNYGDADTVLEEIGPTMELFLQRYLRAEIVKTFAVRVRSPESS